MTMKLKKTEQTTNTEKPVTKDITEIFLDLQEKYKDVYIVEIEDERFMYRPLGRREWCNICDTPDLSALDREEVICDICTLYPENYDFSDCVAGIPSHLSNEIMKRSYLSLDDMVNMISYYRQETNTINSNITCIINEAFPNFDIEDIENWSMDKTIKYFTRAEWKLVNLRGISLDSDILDVIEENRNTNKQDEDDSNSTPLEAETSEIVGTKKTKLTPEKLAELKEKFPYIDWEHDSSLDPHIID